MGKMRGNNEYDESFEAWSYFSNKSKRQLIKDRTLRKNSSKSKFRGTKRNDYI